MILRGSQGLELRRTNIQGTIVTGIPSALQLSYKSSGDRGNPTAPLGVPATPLCVTDA